MVSKKFTLHEIEDLYTFKNFIKIGCFALFVSFLGSTYSPISVPGLCISVRWPPDDIVTELSCEILPSLEITEKGEPILQKFRKSQAPLHQTFIYPPFSN